jgi:hypothetical protein
MKTTSLTCHDQNNPVVRAIDPVRILASLLMAVAVNAQTSLVAHVPHLGDSATERTAFMHACQQDPSASFKSSGNSEQSSLLPAGIERQPTGPWAYFLQGLCFDLKHSIARKLPPPAGIIWRKPGFPAQPVTYEVRNGFCYSERTAPGVLNAIVAAHSGLPWPANPVAISALGERLTLPGLRSPLPPFLSAEFGSRVCLVVDAWFRGLS